MKRSSFLKLSLATVALPGVLAACSNGDSKAPAEGSAAPVVADDAEGPVRVWFMQDSISDEAIAYLEQEYTKANPGKEISIEIQQWDGIISKLQTSLASDTEAPDLVETGNTQSSVFTSVGAFAPVSEELYTKLGGSDLIQSFIEAGTFKDQKYALPLYAGARGIYYRKDLLEAAGIAVPTTIDEFHKAVIDLGKANPEGTDGFSGMYLAAVDIHGVESYLFAAGGDYAVNEGGTWKGQLSTAESQAALTQIQDIFLNGTAYANDSKDGQKNLQQPFNEGKVGFVIGTGNIGTKISQELWDAGKVAVMPFPSTKAGQVGATFAGGSSISIASKAQHPQAAQAVLEIIYSPGFQELIAANGWTPGNTTYADKVTGAFGEISGDVIEASKLTPNTANWGSIVGDNSLQDFFSKVARGDDVKALAQELDAKFDSVLNEA